MITQLELFEKLNYNPYTGLFVWLIRPRLRSKIGDIAGQLTNHGYILIGINGNRYLAHRLAWLYMTGELLENDIDHKDLNRTNNKWNNLREANDSQNKGNALKHKDNTSGKKGVCWDKSRNKWIVRVGKIYLGRFDKIEDAAIIYESAAIKYFGEFARSD